MKAISVTIPVYNVEKYLRRCLDTVIDQTFNLEYEIICVNDGSTDNSFQILKEYDKKYPGKFKIIHQKNKGLSVARNTALKYVTGKYTMFVDSDDFIASNALEKLYEYAECHNSEVVIFDFIKGEKGSKRLNFQHHESVKNKYGHEAFNAKNADISVYRNISVGVWCKFYLTDFIKNIKFVPGIINQDVCHWTEVFTKAERINYYPVPFYFYVINREDSISSDKTGKLFDVFKAFSVSENILREAGLFEKYKVFHYRLFSAYLIIALRKINHELAKEFIETIKNYNVELDFSVVYNGDYLKYEKQDLSFLQFVKEHGIEETENLCYKIGIWK